MTGTRFQSKVEILLIDRKKSDKSVNRKIKNINIEKTVTK